MSWNWAERLLRVVHRIFCFTGLEGLASQQTKADNGPGIGNDIFQDKQVFYYGTSIPQSPSASFEERANP
ncbi:MAG TPA: hypothetical protein VEF04_00930, partial [Blastocatellia bacterium]|nr:hypothetical protein [Blastocatellia bacterium]